MVVNPMDLQRIWTAEYEGSLYLREVHATALAKRYDNLIQNLWSTDHEGKVQKLGDQDRRREILRLLFHVILEQTKRGTRPAGAPLARGVDSENACRAIMAVP